MKHEKGFGCCLGKLKINMKRGLGVAHGSQEWDGKKGLGASWFPSMGWEGSGKSKKEA